MNDEEWKVKWLEWFEKHNGGPFPKQSREYQAWRRAMRGNCSFDCSDGLYQAIMERTVNRRQDIHKPYWEDFFSEEYADGTVVKPDGTVIEAKEATVNKEKQEATRKGMCRKCSETCEDWPEVDPILVDEKDCDWCHPRRTKAGCNSLGDFDYPGSSLYKKATTERKNPANQLVMQWDKKSPEDEPILLEGKTEIHDTEALSVNLKRFYGISSIEKLEEMIDERIEPEISGLWKELYNSLGCVKDLFLEMQKMKKQYSHFEETLKKIKVSDGVPQALQDAEEGKWSRSRDELIAGKIQKSLHNKIAHICYWDPDMNFTKFLNMACEFYVRVKELQNGVAYPDTPPK